LHTTRANALSNGTDVNPMPTKAAVAAVSKSFLIALLLHWNVRKTHSDWAGSCRKDITDPSWNNVGAMALSMTAAPNPPKILAWRSHGPVEPPLAELLFSTLLRRFRSTTFGSGERGLREGRVD
jgi:hypothetical protein